MATQMELAKKLGKPLEEAFVIEEFGNFGRYLIANFNTSDDTMRKIGTYLAKVANLPTEEGYRDVMRMTDSMKHHAAVRLVAEDVVNAWVHVRLENPDIEAPYDAWLGKLHELQHDAFEKEPEYRKELHARISHAQKYVKDIVNDAQPVAGMLR